MPYLSALLLLLLTALPTSGQSVSLRAPFNTGDRVQLDHSSTLLVTLTILSDEGEPESEQYTIRNQTITEYQSGGMRGDTLRVSARTLRTSTTQTLPDGSRLTVNSDSLNAIEDPIQRGMMAAQLGLSLEADVLPGGTVPYLAGYTPFLDAAVALLREPEGGPDMEMYLRGSLEEALTPVLRTSVAQLLEATPQGPVAVGESWSVDAMHTLGSTPFNAQYAYTVERLDEGSATLDVQGRLTRGEDMGAPLNLGTPNSFEGTVEGSIVTQRSRLSWTSDTVTTARAVWALGEGEEAVTLVMQIEGVTRVVAAPSTP